MFEIPCKDYFNGCIMFITGLPVFLNPLVFSAFTVVNNAAMGISELCTQDIHFQSRHHCLGKKKGMLEGEYGIHITAELKCPEKRCQDQKEGFQ